MLNKGDIINLRVDYSDKTGSKIRPVVILAKHDKYSSELNYLEISSKDYLENDEFSINLLKSNYYIKTDSYAKIWKIGTINESILPEDLFVIDKIKPDDLNKILEKLNKYFSQDW